MSLMTDVNGFNASLILPTLNPSEKIFDVIFGAKEAGFKDIIIVNDGSKAEKESIFDRLSKTPCCTVLTHKVNCGKGRALKTAFSFYLENRKDGSGVVTIDDDGQHCTKDICACAEMMEKTGSLVLGVRNFNLPDVPPKSRMGNKLTSFVFATGVGLRISDTQTGLRAIPGKYLEVFINTEGERFEYETNMLIDVKKHSIPLAECQIETLYDNNNSGTHFRPIADSLKIYSGIFKYLGGAVISFLLDISFFYIFVRIFGKAGFSPEASAAVSTVAARVISSAVNFLYNRYVVFKKGTLLKSLAKYYSLCAVQTAVSCLAVTGLVSLMKQIAGPGVATVIKVIVDTVLFVISYLVQKKWVYR